MRKLILTFLVLAAIVAFLPRFGSSDWAKQQIQLRLEKQIGGICEIESISLNWFRAQTCHHVKWHDPKKGLSLEADKVTIQENLIDCIRYREKPLHVSLEGVSLDVTAGMKWLKKTQKDLHIAFSPIDATLNRGEITYQRIELDINEKMRAYSWGTIDLNRERLEITLGLPQQILAKVFKECRHLPEDFLLEIPISCDLSVQSIQKKLFWYILKNYATVTSLHK